MCLSLQATEAKFILNSSDLSFSHFCDYGSISVSRNMSECQYSKKLKHSRCMETLSKCFFKALASLSGPSELAVAAAAVVGFWYIAHCLGEAFKTDILRVSES